MKKEETCLLRNNCARKFGLLHQNVKGRKWIRENETISSSKREILTKGTRSPTLSIYFVGPRTFLLWRHYIILCARAFHTSCRPVDCFSGLSEYSLPDYFLFFLQLSFKIWQLQFSLYTLPSQIYNLPRDDKFTAFDYSITQKQFLYS